VTDLPEGADARSRLDAVASTSDGFDLARIDLEQRREGDVLGVAQSGGRSSLKVLRAVLDEQIISTARVDAIALVESDPALARHPALRLAVESLEAADRAEFLEKS
jgi:ATP-dependent DNA helicase RecG